MELYVDIGNTNISFAVTDGKKMIKRFSFRTDKKLITPVNLKRAVGKLKDRIRRAVVVSVVPGMNPVIKKNLIISMPALKVLFVGRDITVPMKVNYKRPSEVGQDRLVTSYGALKISGGPLLVIDFGTAVTFDLVNAAGEYEGGLIFPGLRLGLQSLARDTALLPYIELKAVKGIIGRDTRSSMRKGILYGYAALCDGVIGLFREEYGKDLQVVATGGDARLVARYSKTLKDIQPDLIFTGLRAVLGIEY